MKPYIHVCQNSGAVSLDFQSISTLLQRQNAFSSHYFSPRGRRNGDSDLSRRVNAWRGGFLLPKSVQAVFLVLRDLDLLLRWEEEQSLLVNRVVGGPHFWGANVLAGVWCLCITLIKQMVIYIYIYIIMYYVSE